MNQTNFWTRRGVLRGLGLGIGAGALAGGLRAPARAAEPSEVATGLSERLDIFLGETDARPDFAWTNREDVMYHDMLFPPEVAGAPEFCAFVNDPVWVFNRATRWVREAGTITCYEEAGDLMLTGRDQVSAWHSGAPNQIASDGDATVFTKKSLRRRDAVILPSFQFRLNQHPVLELQVLGADADWQLCITHKGRSGRPLIASDWHSGPATLSIDLAQELGSRGLEWSYPELHFAIGAWVQDPDRPAQVRFRAVLRGRPAVAGCLPVIRTQQSAAGGVPVAAVVVDARGQPVGRGRVRVAAVVGGRSVDLEESAGVWHTRLRDVPVGDHSVLIRADGDVTAETRCDVRVTDGQFLEMRPGQHWVTRGGKPVGPLTGTYQGTLFFRNAGEAGERMVQGQREWEAWDRSAPDSEHMHFWESLSEPELDQRFRFLQEAGFDLTTLHSHWGDWERLDGGGRIAPHGAEQLARYLRAAGRHGLAHVQGLASGPYGTKVGAYGGTVPYSRYLEAGFQGEQQYAQVGTPFDDLYHQYLRDFATLFGDETALFAMTGAGEGDHFVGPARTNDSTRVVREIDHNHVFLAETILNMKKLPQNHNAGFEQSRFGARTYFIADKYAPEADLGVFYKFLRMADAYLAEGSWSTMPNYVRLHYDVLRDENGSPKCWTGTVHFRVRLRDTLYLGLVHLMPIMNTWDEAFAENEHAVLAAIRPFVDWSQPFAEPPVHVVVDDASADIAGDAYGRLVGIEAALAKLGLGSRFVTAAQVAPRSTSFGVDAGTPADRLRFKSQGGILPDELRRSVPVEVSAGYSTNHAVSADGRTLLAYVYNTTRHEREYYWLGGHYHRSPLPVPLAMVVQRPGNRSLRLRVYDLNTRQLALDTPFAGTQRYVPGDTTHDYLVIVTPS